ncbi:flagellar hook-associated protein FlgL [Aneurinibacillus sp. BA2021]|nr:flagellar hook-associated protein FlgL [Aneurinibacillus sp. BA2021]
MRITQNMLNNSMMGNLNKSLNRMDRLQDMFSSGKKISKPSHDPIVAARGMMYRTSLAENAQYRSNSEDAVDWLTATEDAVDQGRNVLTRLKDLIIQASNDTLNPSDRQKIRDEIIQLRGHLGNVANTTLNGRYLFSGTNTDTAPFKDDAYHNKNKTDIELEMSKGIKLPINVDGTSLFGQQNSSLVGDQLQKEGYKTDIFALMSKIIGELGPSEYVQDQYGRTLAADTNGDPLVVGNVVQFYDPHNPAHRPLKSVPADPTKAIGYDPKDPTKIIQFDSTDAAHADYVKLSNPVEGAVPKQGKELTGYLDIVQNHIDHFLQIQAQVGARINRIQLIQDRLETESMGLETMMSNGEDADMARVIMDLQNNENVHRAALASGSRIIQPTLLDFLR